MKKSTPPIHCIAATLLGAAVLASTYAAETVDLLASEGMKLTKNWEIVDGVLGTSKTPGGIIWSEKAYEDFTISLEYKTSPKCNSGLFFRTDPRNAVQGGFEIQIASHGLYNGKHVLGALYDAQEPSAAAGKPDGEWNTMILTAKGPKITVELNGQKVNEANLDEWKTAKKNPDGSKNKFKTALKDLPRTGHFGLQYHGHPVWFRNIKVTTP